MTPIVFFAILFVLFAFFKWGLPFMRLRSNREGNLTEARIQEEKITLEEAREEYRKQKAAKDCRERTGLTDDEYLLMRAEADRDNAEFDRARIAAELQAKTT